MKVLHSVFPAFHPSHFFQLSPRAASLPYLLLQSRPGIEDTSLSSFLVIYALSSDKCACLHKNYPLNREIAGKEKSLSAGFPAAFQFSALNLPPQPPTPGLGWVFLTPWSLSRTPKLSQCLSSDFFFVLLFFCYHFNFLLPITFSYPLCPPFLEI